MSAYKSQLLSVSDQIFEVIRAIVNALIGLGADPDAELAKLRNPDGRLATEVARLIVGWATQSTFKVWKTLKLRVFPTVSALADFVRASGAQVSSGAEEVMVCKAFTLRSAEDAGEFVRVRVSEMLKPEQSYRSVLGGFLKRRMLKKLDDCEFFCLFNVCLTG